MIGADYLALTRRQDRANRIWSRLMCRTALGGALSIGLGTGLFGRSALADPSGGQVVGGQATIQQSGTHTQINQGSQTAIINWQNFDINTNESVNFAQPNTRSLAVNRVQSDIATNIAGELTANGNVWIENRSGVFIRGDARVNVGGLVATTARIDTDALDMTQGVQTAIATGAIDGTVVSNEGAITAEGGSVVLVAPVVDNSGAITANAGDVALGAGSGFTVDFEGDQLTRFEVAPGNGVSLTNSGTLSAQGGAVYISAAAADAVQESVVSIGGKVEATRIEDRGGVIVISGGETGVTEVTGEVTAAQTEGDGGRVVVTGDKVDIAPTAVIDASGAQSGGRVEIGGGYRGASIQAPVVRTYAAPETAPLPTAKRTRVQEGAVIRANAGAEGNGGTVITWAEEITGFYGHIEARGGFLSGDGGFAEISGKERFDLTGSWDLTAANGVVGTVLLDPDNIVIIDGGTATPIADVLFADNPGGTTTLDASYLNDATAALLLQAEVDITISETVSAAVDLTFEAGNNINVNAPLATTGNLTLSAADADAAAPSLTGTVTFGETVAGMTTLTGGLTAADIVLSGAGGMTLGGITASGTLSVTSGGAIAQTTVGLDVTGASTFTAGTGLDVTLDATANAFGPVVAGSGAAVNVTASTGSAVNIVLSDSRADLTLADINTSGTLSVTSAGAIDQIAAGLDVAGVATFIAGDGEDVTLDATANAFGPAADGNTVAINVTASSGQVGSVAITDSRSDLTLGDIDASGTMTAIAPNGQINQPGGAAAAGDAINVGGAATLVTDTTTSDDVILSDPQNDFGGAVSVRPDGGVASRSITLVGANDIILGDIDATETLTVTSTAGGISQAVSGVPAWQRAMRLNVTGLSTFTSRRPPGLDLILDSGPQRLRR